MPKSSMFELSFEANCSSSWEDGLSMNSRVKNGSEMDYELVGTPTGESEETDGALFGVGHGRPER